MTKLMYVFVIFHADFSNVPDITTGLKRSQTDGTLDQVSHREKMEQTFRVRYWPKSQTKNQAGSYPRWGKEMEFPISRSSSSTYIYFKDTASLFMYFF